MRSRAYNGLRRIREGASGMGIARENELQDIVREILADYGKDRVIDQRDVSTQVDENIVVDIVKMLLHILLHLHDHQ